MEHTLIGIILKKLIFLLVNVKLWNEKYLLKLLSEVVTQFVLKREQCIQKVKDSGWVSSHYEFINIFDTEVRNQ